MGDATSIMGTRHGEVRALLERGIKFIEKGKPANALRAFEEAVKLDPASAEAFFHRGNALCDLGQVFPAIASYDRAIALKPQLVEAHDFRGVALSLAGQLDEALASVDRALAIAPNTFNALNNRANILKDLGRLEEALMAFDVVVQRAPTFPAGHKMRANVLARLGRHEEALNAFDHVCALDPSDADSRCNAGIALLLLGRKDEAIAAFQAALAINANHPDSLVNLGNALAADKRSEAAEAAFRRCLARDPKNIDAGLGLGALLSRQRRFDEAGRCYQNVLKVDLNNRIALSGLGQALEELGEYESALTCYDHILTFLPEDVRAHRKRGGLLVFLSRHAEAIEALDHAATLAPDPSLATTRLYAALHLSRWADFDQSVEQVRAAVDQRRRDILPFPILAFVDDPGLHLNCSKLAAAIHDTPTARVAARHVRHDKIRLAYFSADFHNHATMHLFAETLEAHDRDRFELSAFWFGKEWNDAWRERAKAAVDSFVDVRLVEDQAVAKLARDREIDIAVDLKGYTQNGRFGIFAERAAPIQVSYLGYPGTSGANCIDYLLADDTVICPETRPYYSESIVYLPGSYQPNAALRPLLGQETRESVGLPVGAIVLCCFNQNYKITPTVFSVWMDILRHAGHSVLWLWVERDSSRENLAREAEARGIDPARIIFARAKPLEEHLDRLRLADLFLDTLPYNAHTSGSDALRAGVPIVTCVGKSFATRVAASLLNAVNLPELITESLEDYKALAISLASDRSRLANLRERLRTTLATSSLFDPRAAARKLEAAYVGMYERYQSGKEPEDFRVAV